MVNLWRNREVRIYFLLLAVLGIAGFGVCFYIDLWAGIAVAVMYTALILSTVFFTKRRYRDIADLSAALARICGGDYSVDLRQYAEGELSILHDELHKVTATLSHQARSLRRDKQYLSDMMADISHQLKTPLTSISVMTELLFSPSLPEKKREEFLVNVRAGCDRIRWLVMALLKLSRLDADAVELRREKVSLREIAQNALEPMRVLIEVKNITLKDEIEDIFLDGDAGWLVEAVGNLVKNAVEHAPEGGEVRLSCSDNPLYTLLEIGNNGPDIPADELPYVFDRFFRGKNAAPDSVGIGLALAKSIVQRHGGVIEAGNVPGYGTSFVLKFYKAVF